MVILLRSSHFTRVTCCDTLCVYFCSLPGPPFDKCCVSIFSFHWLAVWWCMPLTGLSWLPTALGCNSGLHQLLRHHPRTLLLMSLIGWMREDVHKQVKVFCITSFSFASIAACKFLNKLFIAYVWISVCYWEPSWSTNRRTRRTNKGTWYVS